MAEVEKPETTLDLSRQGLKKLTKVQPLETQGIATLILDYNELQRWDNIDCYSSLKKLSASHNQLLRMYGVSRLHHLCSLDLSYNSILTIEGLKELVHLKWLCLASNNIKTIEHLHTNIHLEHLDLSENSITHIADISFLKNLKQLLLHGNRISQLRQCDRHLPASLTVLTLAHNNLGDLNDMSHLAHLINLREFSIAGNPCVNMTGSSIGFDYRPFVINWCMSLKVIDGYVVDAIESLKAEWLYSQGRGRQFHAGEQQTLAQYLAGVCPLSGDTLQSEEERKLRLILSKAQQHQQALRDQVTTNGTARPRSQILNRSQSSPAPSPAARRRVGSFRNSSRSAARDSKLPLVERAKSPDRMVTSCQGVPAVTGETDPADVPQLMSQSLDPSLLFSTGNLSKDSSSSEHNSAQANQSQEDSSSSEINSGGNCPLQAASKLVPVPESLMSPDYRPINPVVNRVMRPRSGTVGHTNGHHSSSVSTRQTGSVHSSPKMCRSLHASPRQRARSAIEPRGVHSLQQHLSHGHSHGHRHGPRKIFGHEPTSSDEDSEMSASKLETIRHRAQERWQRKEVVAPPPTTASAAENAAVIIQRMWRGYHARNLNSEVQAVLRKIQDSRTQQYIEKLSNDMEATRAALESDRKLQVLKMQAINAIWKKVLTMQPGGSAKEETASSSQKSDTEAIRELTQTCSMLHNQVEQLQGSMQSMLQCMSVLCQMPGIAPNSVNCPSTVPASSGPPQPVTVEPRATATQTDIIAVITPQEETIPFPYQRGGSSRARPSSLPIPQHRAQPNRPNPEAPNEVQQFATSLVDGVLRTVTAEGEPVDSCTSDADTSAPTMEDIANGCMTSTEQEGNPIVELGCVVNSGGNNGNIPPEAQEEEEEEEEQLQESASGINENMTQSVLSLEENSTNIVVCKEPPSPGNVSVLEETSPNNNQKPLPTENGETGP